MISAINGINSFISAPNIYAAQLSLTEQTRSQLQNMGINTAGIKSEAQGQFALQQAASSQNSQNAQGAQGTQNAQNAQMQPSHQGGNPLMKALMEDALSLAQKVGANVSIGDDLSKVLSAISDRLTQLQTEAASNPQKLAQVTAYQAEYMSICELANSIQASMAASCTQKVQMDSSAIQTSMTGLANYNLASMSISTSNKMKF
jgi:hypothetical protein